MKNHRLHSVRSTALLAVLFSFAISVTAASSLFAQASQYYHSAGIVLDDGAGHTVLLAPPTNGTGGTVTFPSGLTFPTTNAAGSLTNDGNGGLSWAPAGGSFTPAYLNAYSWGTQFSGSLTAVTFTYSGSVGFTAMPDKMTFIANTSGVYSFDFMIAPHSSPSSFALRQWNGGFWVDVTTVDCPVNVPTHATGIVNLLSGNQLMVVNEGSAVSIGPIFSPGLFTTTASLTVIRIQ